MNISDIAKRLNKLSKTKGFQVANIQDIRTNAKGIRKTSNDTFDKRTVFESDHYAYHYGGRKELQFNIGLEGRAGKNYLRYGLGLSFEPSQTVPDPLYQMDDLRLEFNAFIKAHTGFCGSYQMWYYRGPSTSEVNRFELEMPRPVEADLQPQLHDFFFFGKLSKKPVEQLTEDDLIDVLHELDQLLPMYRFVELGEEDALSEPEERVARVCWNTLGWKKPSGIGGKSKTPGIHTTEYGYGHEEWLFDFDKIINGYHYGFLEPVRKQRQAYAHRTFNVTVYSYNKTEKQWYWIARINDLQVIGEKESQRIFNEYDQKGWIDEMIQNIENIGGDVDQFERDWANEALFNVRFKYQDVDFFDQNPIPFEREELDLVAGGTRYTFYYKKNEIKSRPGSISEKVSNGFQPNSPIDERTLEDKIRKIKRTFTNKEVSHPDLHARIQNALHQYLEELSPGRTQREAPAYGNTKIDLKYKNRSGGFTYFEVKSYNHPLTSIRVALGQLLEYGYFNNDDPPKELIIVTHQQVDEETVDYIKTIRTQFSIPIGYICFDYEKRKILQEITSESFQPDFH